MPSQRELRRVLARGVAPSWQAAGRSELFLFGYGVTLSRNRWSCGGAERAYLRLTRVIFLSTIEKPGVTILQGEKLLRG
jgi:hypothetical protein